MGEAVDALPLPTESDDNAATLIIVQSLRPDRFFTAKQQKRLSELMERFRAARATGTALPDNERTELEQLVDAELIAARQRTEALFTSSASGPAR